ncbi:MAG: DNA-directed RNA polymerase subunit omega [Candidatus Omnitrophota bacterium]
MNETYIPLEKLIKVTDGSIYKLTLLVAKRALQLADGDKPMIEKPGEKVLDNALREIAEGRIRPLVAK